MKKSTLLLIGIVIIAAIAFYAYRKTAPIPDLALSQMNIEDLSGNPVNLTFKSNRPLVVLFWSTTSKNSQNTITALSKIQQKYGSQVNFILVSDEEANKITVYKSTNMLPFFFVRSIKPIDEYGIHHVPALYFFSADNKLLAKESGNINASNIESFITKTLQP